MDSGASANPLGALLGFWMLIQLVLVLGLLLGGIYALFCLHRTAANLDRVASAVEELVARPAPPTSPPPPPIEQHQSTLAPQVAAPIEVREPLSPSQQL